MHTATAKLKSLSPYSQGRHHETPKMDRETSDAFEKRTWRERLHADEKGMVYVPPMAFKNCISEVAKYLGKKIPGKGKSTYTKHFEAGVLVLEPLPLGIKKEDVPAEWVFVPADGRRGGSTRVMKCFGVIPQWSGKVTFTILDDAITEDVFREHLQEAGQFIGIGRFRPRNNGYYGRFSVESVKWD